VTRDRLAFSTVSNRHCVCLSPWLYAFQGITSRRTPPPRLTSRSLREPGRVSWARMRSACLGRLSSGCCKGSFCGVDHACSFAARNGPSVKGWGPMAGPEFAESVRQPSGFPSRKVASVFTAVSDSLQAWMDRYQSLAVAGVRSGEVAAKVALHLRRFRSFFLEAYRQERISTVGRRDVIAWQRHLVETLAPSTVNNHLTSLSALCSGR
jgi:hypothetical protein